MELVIFLFLFTTNFYTCKLLCFLNYLYVNYLTTFLNNVYVSLCFLELALLFRFFFTMTFCTFEVFCSFLPQFFVVGSFSFFYCVFLHQFLYLQICLSSILILKKGNVFEKHVHNLNKGNNKKKGNMCIVIVFLPGCDVINFEILTLSF